MTVVGFSTNNFRQYAMSESSHRTRSIAAMTAGLIAWHALVAATGGGVDLTVGCYVGRHSLSSRLPGAGQRVPAAVGQ